MSFSRGFFMSLMSPAWQADSLPLVPPGKPPTHRADSKGFRSCVPGIRDKHSVLFLITGTQNFVLFLTTAYGSSYLKTKR